jgi:hypothetical protein
MVLGTLFRIRSAQGSRYLLAHARDAASGCSPLVINQHLNQPPSRHSRDVLLRGGKNAEFRRLDGRALIRQVLLQVGDHRRAVATVDNQEHLAWGGAEEGSQFLARCVAGEAT